MNRYYKYCPCVFLAECEEQHKKGDIITITTKFGKENEHIIHNFIKEKNGKFLYSITREDGFNSQTRALNKIERRKEWSDLALEKSDNYYKKSKKDSEFLSLLEPIKVGHHSEKRHRKIIKEAQDNADKWISFADKSKEHLDKISYWEKQAEKIDLSIPESIDFFSFKLEEAKAKHKFLKENPKEREHSYSLTYAGKEVKELERKLKIAVLLWG